MGVPMAKLTLDGAFPKGWNQGFLDAYAIANSTPCGIVSVSDSFGVMQSSDWNTKSWPALVRTRLLDGEHNLGGDFFPCSASADFQASISGTAWSGTPPWVVSATARSYFGMPLGHT